MAEKQRNWFYNSILSFNERDLATGEWFRRVGRPVLVMFFAVYTFYFVVTRVAAIPGSQIGILVIFYINIQLILGIILYATVAKVYGSRILYAFFIIGVVVTAAILGFLDFVVLFS